MFGDATSLSSAAGVLALLEDPDPKLNIYALNRLDTMIPVFWPEISEKIDQLEMLYENTKFSDRELAALLVSKLYFQLGDLDESLNYALAAASHFDISEASEFVETIAFKCIDSYTAFRQKNEKENCEDAVTDSCDQRMEKLVERMLYQSLSDGKLCEAAGIAIETRRYDILEDAIKGKSSSQVDEMIDYVAKLCLTVVEEAGLRKKILLLLVKISKQTSNPNYINVCSCLVHLNDATMVAEILKTLVESDDNSNKLVGYQIALDLYENATQGFIKRVTNMLAPASEEEKLSSSNSSKNLTQILSGDLTTDLHLQFLIRNNNADIQILQKTKDHVKNSVTHNATVIANSIMYAGTTCDSFLRENLDWLARATNWAKFTATSSLGVIHKGHEADALKLMSVYLPKDSSTPSSPYQEGGGFFALGLIHANHGNADIIKYIKDQLTEVENGKAKAEPAKHGALLGLGLCAMGTHDWELYELIREQLSCDDAVIGEAAGVAMGLLMAGSNNKDVLEEMINYARETQHEKIIRGLSLGIALILYGQLNSADDTLNELLEDKEFLLRRAACLGMGLAWAGTGNNEALSKMLHIAVSDVSDDVRRASVQSIGFILARNPENCPHVVELLSHSYNPHVRCGAATALGIACAATANKEALTLLEPMVNDPVNFVRQSATIAASMILMQHTEHSSGDKSKKFRDIFQKMVEDKHEDHMGKYGAIIAQGIIDAGGRNAAIHIADQKTGHVHMPSVIGLACFLNSWYWFPMSHFLSLALRPASMIMLNVNLELPRMEVRCNAKPSSFAYPPKMETKKEEKKEKVKTAVLSVTAKAKRGEKKDGTKPTEEKKSGEDMDTSAASSAPKSNVNGTVGDKKKDSKDAASDKKSGETGTSDSDKKESSKKKKEPNHTILENPFRALPSQLKYLTLQGDCKYSCIKSLQTGGIILVNNSKPNEKEDLVERVSAGGPKMAKDGDSKDEEANPPAAFEWKDEYEEDAKAEPAATTTAGPKKKDDDSMDDSK